MFALDSVVVIVLLAGAVFGTVLLVTRTRDHGAGGRGPARGPAQWRVTHRDVSGETRVLVQKVSGISILNEHVVAAIPVDDPAYDDKFLAAMNTARERRALFESEDE